MVARSPAGAMRSPAEGWAAEGCADGCATDAGPAATGDETGCLSGE
jgi:hypothetical protein